MSVAVPSRRFAALGGIVIGAFALSVAELLGGLSRNWRSPMLDVGDRVIDHVPPFVKDFAIERFGTNDKPALLIGIAVGVVAFAAVVVGIVGLRGKRPVGIAGVLAFGLIGSLAARARRTSPPWHVVVPSLGGALAGLLAFLAVDSLLRRRAPAAQPAQTETAESESVEVVVVDATPVATNSAALPTGGGRNRRWFLGAGAATAALAAVSAPLVLAGRRLGNRFTATESRRAVVLPTPAERLPPTADIASFDDVEGLASYFTPNADFYRIDTALSVPQVRTEDYTLRITGMVERELEFSFDELLRRSFIERDITLTCVSNQIGGNLVGNARWIGTRLDELLAEAGILEGADQIVGRAVDGYTCGFPVAVLEDGRDAIVAVGMNGEPLPLEHGFPVRLVVPGLYGYLSATKWLTEIEVTTFDAFTHYWARRDYAVEAPIKMQSRIDTPRALARVAVGESTIAGVAWAQTVGIKGVDVRIDDGEWEPAELARVDTVDTWVQWRLPWEATEGRHSVMVRAISSDGTIQTDERSEPLPDGASGLHQIVVLVG